MGYTALYRKFRPIRFCEMVGQEHITKTLKNQIIANRVGHAYLFNGGRGTGKTSAAKILARAINCQNPKDGEPCNECEICKGAISGSLTDIVEMDAASNNSVEDIRAIREEVNFLPTKAKYRVYIIDEVHMLSQGAFNALLKTLEEPPEHVKFILATTEPQKLPATILSRCQRFDFKKVSNENIIKRLKIVCQESNIEITEGALNIIAVLSEGAVRDALSILERCIQDGENKIDEAKIKDLVGIPKLEYVHKITEAIIKYNVEEALNVTNKVLDDGKELTNFVWEIIKYIKDVLIYKSSGKLEIYSEEEKQKIDEISKIAEKQRLINLVYELSSLDNEMKKSTQKIIMFQAGLINMCNEEVATHENNNISNNNKNNSNNNLEERILKIEKYLKQGNMLNTQVVNNAGFTGNTSNVNRVIPTSSVINGEISSAKGKKATVGGAQATAKVKPQKSYPTEASKYWPQIIQDIKSSGKIVLYTNLMNTTAVELNDMTVGIEFPNGLTSFGKTVLEKQENKREIANLVSIACGKEMQIKYISGQNAPRQMTNEENLQNFAKEQNIPFEVIE
ncbi:MAG: DNA polymerase III subunit gamma/tau [Clostridia bacterium]|nr:DNA polymerase III subunit gamma/tau [Clostridia bacterium]